MTDWRLIVHGSAADTGVGDAGSLYLVRTRSELGSRAKLFGTRRGCLDLGGIGESEVSSCREHFVPPTSLT